MSERHDSLIVNVDVVNKMGERLKNINNNRSANSDLKMF